MGTTSKAKAKTAAVKKAATTATKYKVRFNTKVKVSQINKILDALDANKGYCPCQLKSKDTKCHCKDFLKNKKIGEPCICNIYVKQKA